jgi:hypothetical protein
LRAGRTIKKGKKEREIERERERGLVCSIRSHEKCSHQNVRALKEQEPL